MQWRWLVMGLAGMVGMMLNTLADSDATIEPEHSAKLAELIGQLQGIQDQLTARSRHIQSETFNGN